MDCENGGVFLLAAIKTLEKKLKEIGEILEKGIQDEAKKEVDILVAAFPEELGIISILYMMVPISQPLNSSLRN